MRKTFFLVAALLIGSCIFAQDSSWRHVQITVVPRLLSNKINVEVDYGQDTKFFSDTRMKDDAGRAMKFNSVSDILNYMSKEKWELITAQAFYDTNAQQRWSILMRRKELVSNK
jgi:hypothetical protein